MTSLEGYTRLWFEKNFRLLGFESILSEGTLAYDRVMTKIGREMIRNGIARNFREVGKPDYLGFKEGKWVRIEVEGQTSNYWHLRQHNDFVLCFVNNRMNQEPFEGKEIIEVAPLVNGMEKKA